MSTISATSCEPLGSAAYLRLLAQDRLESEKQQNPDKAENSRNPLLSNGLQTETKFNAELFAAITATDKNRFADTQNPSQNPNQTIFAYQRIEQLQPGFATTPPPGSIFDGYA